MCVCVSVYIVYIVQVLENLSVRALMSTFARSIPFAPIEMCFPIHGAHIEDALNIFHYLRSSVTHVFPHEDQFQIRQIPPIKLKSPLITSNKLESNKAQWHIYMDAAEDIAK